MGEMVVIAMMVVAIVLIAGVSINGIVDKVMQHKRLRYEAEGAPAGSDIREIAERQQAIEDRLRVLERIATDRGSLLADEIEALRAQTPALPKVKDTA
ncbi:hypothetical protein [Porphyrobacter sp. AAP82]|uniref:hypothetical protein n=1 Tax=Porphyrobacter sp. AAP82 TaxID=1248917 RepID=UPI00031990B1|nr:hypothetical protein [Porphyrobacter sp. AAP82]